MNYSASPRPAPEGPEMILLGGSLRGKQEGGNSAPSGRPSQNIFGLWIQKCASTITNTSDALTSLHLVPETVSSGCQMDRDLIVRKVRLYSHGLVVYRPQKGRLCSGKRV